jgi:hypothetical protein
MALDGKNQERVTNDHRYNDWFPRLSPDGDWIVIISYGLDIQPTDHPYYKHCYLRIMPADGSVPLPHAMHLVCTDSTQWLRRRDFLVRQVLRHRP